MMLAIWWHSSFWPWLLSDPVSISTPFRWRFDPDSIPIPSWARLDPDFISIPSWPASTRSHSETILTPSQPDPIPIPSWPVLTSTFCFGFDNGNSIFYFWLSWVGSVKSRTDSGWCLRFGVFIFMILSMWCTCTIEFS